LETEVVAAGEQGGRPFVVTADTILYPEGGGQPADRGTIAGVEVLDVRRVGGEIRHLLSGRAPSGRVTMELDWTRRFDHMQQHTAQHLLSQVVLNLFAAQTLSFAIGSEHSSIEIDLPALDDDAVKALERECAAAVFAALPVRVFESDDAATLGLRKPPKRQGRVRVVEIGGLDRSACGGTHLRNSAEIGLLKVVRSERVRAHVRLYYAAGWRALRDYQLRHEVTRRLQRLVTLPLAEIPAQVETWQAEKEELRRALKKAQRRALENEVAAAAAGADPLVVREFSGSEAAEMRFFSLELMKRGKHVLAYGAEPPRPVVVGRGRGSGDLRAVSAPFFALLGGRGGGGENLLEGRGSDLSRLDEAVSLLRTVLV
jgi:Ser-tRNA(Ala) deacylase AlaX